MDRCTLMPRTRSSSPVVSFTAYRPADLSKDSTLARMPLSSGRAVRPESTTARPAARTTPAAPAPVVAGGEEGRGDVSRRGDRSRDVWALSFRAAPGAAAGAPGTPCAGDGPSPGREAEGAVDDAMDASTPLFFLRRALLREAEDGVALAAAAAAPSPAAPPGGETDATRVAARCFSFSTESKLLAMRAAASQERSRRSAARQHPDAAHSPAAA